MAATASTVRRWVLVEQTGAWGRDALLESGLPAVPAARLKEIGRESGTKALLIRHRNPRDEGWEGGPHLVVAARSEVGSERLVIRNLAHIADVGHIDLQEWLDDAAHLVPDRPFIAVCTNGKHDRCCADFGRPLVRAFRADPDAEVWECSHIGGDRFAANVLVLPHGLYFGRVPPEDAAAFHAELLAGRIPLECYRGRSSLSRPAQVAELAARTETGERAVAALTAWSVEQVADRRWVVALTLAGREVEVEVAEGEPDEPRLLTCGATTPSVVRPLVAAAVRT